MLSSGGRAFSRPGSPARAPAAERARPPAASRSAIATPAAATAVESFREPRGECTNVSLSARPTSGRCGGRAASASLRRRSRGCRRTRPAAASSAGARRGARAGGCRSRCWKSAPTAATPKVPPTMRLIERMPEATPALVSLNRVHRGRRHGDIVSADPEAHQREGGKEAAVARVDGDQRLEEERDRDEREADRDRQPRRRCGPSGGRRAGRRR